MNYAILPTMSNTPSKSPDPGLDNDLMWQAVADRDASFDGKVFYAVLTTGIYCRPSCSSRRPKRGNTTYFFDQATAEKKGFRACKKCHPHKIDPRTIYPAELIAACKIFEDELEQDTGVQVVAAKIGVSDRTLRNLFDRHLGVSPKRYLDAVRQMAFRRALKQGDNVTDAIYGAGYGAASRAYEMSGSMLGMTPSRYAQGGEGETIYFTVRTVKLGYIIAAGTESGLCCIRLGDKERVLRQELSKEFSAAILHEDHGPVVNWGNALADYIDSNCPWPTLPIDISATAFQAKVWAALRALPAGMTATYSEIAEKIGQPKATRAVATACAANPVALAIPCHRILPKAGGTGGYRWGPERKLRLLKLEAE